MEPSTPPPPPAFLNGQTRQYTKRPSLPLQLQTPQLQPVLFNNKETHEKIVEILSATANGCLSELGYFPGIRQRLAELEQQNKTWQNENVKLYQDNRHLLATVQEQKALLKSVSISDAEKIQRIRQLELGVQNLVEQRDDALKKSQLTNYAHLETQFNKLKETYERAYNENHRLNALLAQNRQPIHGQPMQTAYVPTQAPPGYMMARTSPILPLSGSTSQTQLPPGTWQGGLPTSPAGISHPQNISQVQVQAHNNQLAQTQQAILENRARRLSHAQSPGTEPIPSQQQQAPQPHRSAHYRPSVDSQDPIAFVANLRNTRQPSNPNTAQMHPYADNAHSSTRRLSLQPSPSPALQVGSAPSGGNTNSITADGKVALQVQGQRSAPPAMPPNPVMTAVSPNILYMNPPTPQQQLMASPTNSVAVHSIPAPPMPDVEKTKNPTPPPPIPTIDTNFHLPDPAFPPPEPQIASTSGKRESISMSDGDGVDTPEWPQKRRRLENLDPVPAEPMSAPSPSSIRVAIETTAMGAQDAMQVDDEEEDEDEIEIGPDGLRLVKDCLPDLFDESDDGTIRICKLCQHRYESKHIAEPVPPFVNAPDDKLEAHCIAEHEEVWAMLRRVDGVDT